MIDICSFPDYLLVQIVLKKSLKYKSEVFLGLFADARIGILGLSQAGAWEGDNRNRRSQDRDEIRSFVFDIKQHLCSNVPREHLRGRGGGTRWTQQG